MSAIIETQNVRTRERIQDLIEQAQDSVARRTDRFFAGLLIFQWLGAIVLALWATPLTWSGTTARTHPHVWASLVLGLAVIALPVALGVLRPGRTLTRHVIAIGQMLSSGLLIHLTGGRIETHFHIFGSLAFLAFYRDWRVLITATVVTAVDHFARGALWPESVYGISIGSVWRGVEHSGWVAFIDLFLIYSCLRGQSDIRATAEKQVELENERAHVEERVLEKTRELREREEDLRRTRGQLMEAIESLDAGLVMYGPDERLVICNTKYKEIHAASAHVMIPGTPYEEILRDFAKSGVHEHELKAVSAEEWVARRLATHRNPGEATVQRLANRWIHFSDHPTSDGGVVSLRTDITPLKLAQEAAEAASRAKSDFLANMSHEIRTPMNGILGLTDLLLDGELTREQRDLLSLVKSSGDCLLTVINDILDFSKIEAGKLDIDPAPFLLREVVSDTLKAVALRAHDKGLELTCDIAPDVTDSVVSDAGRLRQILTNLVGNAIKFTETGEVEVRVRQSNDPDGKLRFKFTVRDTGIGIPKDKQATIFEAFTQADGTMTRRYGGTGLGLTISSRLVALMGGRIWVESEPGVGSSFHFEVCVERAIGSAVKSAIRPSVKMHDLAVLVVDDNPTNLRVLDETLRLWGARPTCVDSGPLALTELRRAAQAGEPYPLILLDAMMPGMDGFTVAEQVAREPDLAGASIMMLTSADRQGDAARCRKIGLAAYLVKPVKMIELQRMIGTILGQESSIGASLSRIGLKKQILPAADTPPPVRPLHILLAEDNVVNQRVAVRLLQGYGHTVIVANHGGEAVAALNREQFDLVLMDVQMPVMDGFEATRAIRVKEAGIDRQTPIVAMTAHAMKGDRERCLAAGMDEYLSKPVQRDELQQVLAWVSQRKETPLNPSEKPAIDEPPQLPSAVDRATALERLGGDEELFEELAGLFRVEGPRMLQEIREALEAGDPAAVQRTAHGLKGAASYLGGTQTAEAAHRLEQIGSSRDLSNARPELRQLEGEIDRMLAALDATAPVSAGV